MVFFLARVPEERGLLEPLIGDLAPWLYADSYLWTVVGLAGAAVFSSRFLFQWLQSEKEKQLVVPAYFWHLSFWGSVLNLVYGLHLDKLPIILGYLFLPFLYGRNLVLLGRSEDKTLRSGRPGGEDPEDRR